jgi:hypothetical protein
MKKVAYNSQYGGFSVSLAAHDRLIELGHPAAVKYEAYMKLHNLRQEALRYKSVHYDDRDYHIRRHDPLLIQVIEELKEAANGSCCSIKIDVLENNEHYVIEEFDGKEEVKRIAICECCN